VRSAAARTSTTSASSDQYHKSSVRRHRTLSSSPTVDAAMQHRRDAHRVLALVMLRLRVGDAVRQVPVTNPVELARRLPSRAGDADRVGGEIEKPRRGGVVPGLQRLRISQCRSSSIGRRRAGVPSTLRLTGGQPFVLAIASGRWDFADAQGRPNQRIITVRYWSLTPAGFAGSARVRVTQSLGIIGQVAGARSPQLSRRGGLGSLRSPDLLQASGAAIVPDITKLNSWVRKFALR
jgi:hypothetical protein